MFEAYSLHALACPTGAVVVRAAVREKDPNKRVVITGMGVASVFGNDVEHFYNWCVAACPERFATASQPRAHYYLASRSPACQFISCPSFKGLPALAAVRCG